MAIIPNKDHSFFSPICYFLFLEKKKVTKENSSQTRSLRAFCQANATIAECLLSTRSSASRCVQLGERYVNITFLEAPEGSTRVSRGFYPELVEGTVFCSSPRTVPEALEGAVPELVEGRSHITTKDLNKSVFSYWSLAEHVLVLTEEQPKTKDQGLKTTKNLSLAEPGFVLTYEQPKTKD